MRDLNILDVKAVSGAGGGDVEEDVKLPKQQEFKETNGGGGGSFSLGNGDFTATCCSANILGIDVEVRAFTISGNVRDLLSGTDPFDSKLGIETGL